MMPNYFRFGGVYQDLPEGLLEKMHTFFSEKFLKSVDDLDNLIGGNEIFQSRRRVSTRSRTEEAIDMV